MSHPILDVGVTHALGDVDGAAENSDPAADIRDADAAERDDIADDSSAPTAERTDAVDGSGDPAADRSDTAPDSGDAAAVHSPAVEKRTPTVDIDELAAAIAEALIDQTWLIRDPVDRYAALQDRRAALLRAAQLLHEESTAELLMMRKRRLTLGEIAALITKRVHRISEATVRAYVAVAQSRTVAAE